VFRFGLRLSVGLLGLCLVSCAKDNPRKPVFPVHGKVVDKDGKPATGALLVFHPVVGDAEPIKPSARVENDGSFALTTYDNADGAPEGEYLVTVTWHQVVPHKGYNPSPSTPDKLAGRYAKLEKSKLRFRIDKQDDNVLELIQLH